MHNQPPHKPRVEAEPGFASPLGAAILANDRATMTMVRDALATRRLALAYQPVVLARDPGRVAFHEALIRLLDPSGRPIPARDFMDAVEEHELGREIDCASLDLGLAALARNPGLRLSINMSARSIGYGRWMKSLRKGLSASPTVAERLILEITEKSAMTMPEVVATFMDDLHMLGVAFALDDFGAGYTAIRHFKDFFFDILKIDGQFIRAIDSDPDNQALTGALTSIGRHFDMFVVAEAVETAAEAEYLIAMGIDCLQGYLFGAPALKPHWMTDAPAQKRA